MFAVIRTGGKQYRVAPNDIIEVEKIAGQPGDIVELAEVLLLGGDGGPKTGSPTISGALVAAEVIEQRRSSMKRLKNSKVLAERVGFEPTVRLPVQRFSRPSRSTTPAPLRGLM